MMIASVDWKYSESIEWAGNPDDIKVVNRIANTVKQTYGQQFCGMGCDGKVVSEKHLFCSSKSVL
jgi:hypothetical protein